MHQGQDAQKLLSKLSGSTVGVVTGWVVVGLGATVVGFGDGEGAAFGFGDGEGVTVGAGGLTLGPAARSLALIMLSRSCRATAERQSRQQQSQ